MLIKNSLKLLLNNLNAIFKTLLYSLVVVLLTYLLISVFFSDLVTKVVETEGFKNFVTQIGTVWNSFISGNLRPEVDFVTPFEQLMDTVRLNLLDYLLPVIGFIIGFYLISVLNNLCSYTLTSMMDARMSAYEKKAFLETFIAELKNSLPFEAWYSLLTVLAFVISASIGLLFIVYTFTTLYLTSVIIGLWLFTLAYSAYLAVTALFRPASVNGVRGKALFVNKYTARDFWQILASYVFSLMLFAAVNVSMFVSTLGAGLIISIPVTQLYFVFNGLVLYYSIEGKKYYMDYEHVITPNKIKKDARDAEFLDNVEM